MNIWNLLPLNGGESETYLFSFISDANNSSYTLRVTDTISMYQETMTSSVKIQRKCEDLNPAIEASTEDLLEELKCLLFSKTSYFDLSEDRDVLKVQGKLFGYDFKWKFSLTKCSDEQANKNLMREVFLCLGQLLAEQQKLMQVIRAKDLEIFDFEQSGAVLTRKTLKTDTFDPKVLETVSPTSTALAGEEAKIICSEEYKLVQIRTIADKSVISKSTPTKDLGSEKARRKRIRIRGREDLYGGSDDEEETTDKSKGGGSVQSSPIAAPRIVPKANKKVAKKLRKL